MTSDEVSLHAHHLRYPKSRPVEASDLLIVCKYHHEDLGVGRLLTDSYPLNPLRWLLVVVQLTCTLVVGRIWLARQP